MSNQTVCRIALADDNEPYLVTMSYGLHIGPDTVIGADGSVDSLLIYLHSAAVGRKIDMLRRNPRVCFSIEGHSTVVAGDEPCRWTRRYESIVGYGTLEIVHDDDERRIGLDAIMRQHGAKPPYAYAFAAVDQVHVLRLSVRKLTGKSNLASGAAASADASKHAETRE